MFRTAVRSIAFSCIWVGTAFAQPLGADQNELLESRRANGSAVEVQPSKTDPTQKPGITTAPASAQPVPSPLASAPQFVFRDFKIEGNTVIDDAAIRTVVAPYLNKSVSIADLEDIRRGLTLLYINRGYINSGFTVPDQDVGGGIVTFRAVEGRATGIDVSGTEHFDPDYFSARLERGLTTPFNVAEIERQQQMLLQDPLVRRLNIELLPGLVPGEAKLHADVLEASPYSLTTQIANNQSPTVGEVRGQLQGTISNLLGVGDVLLMQYGRSQGINDGAISYSVPLASDDTRLNVRYDINGTVVITPALSPLHVTSRYDSLAVGLSRPFYRNAEQTLTLGANLDWRRAQSFLLGQPFSFTAGSNNGETNVTALRLYQDWLDRDAEHAFALRSTFSFGLDALGATVTAMPPTGTFFSWLGQTQYVRRVYSNWEAVIRSDLQLSNHPLFPIEQFALGGIDTVRGYRQYLTITDDAFFASGELRIPVTTLRLPYISDTEDAGTLQIVPFYDFGRGWNINRPTPYPAEISGVGAGLRWLIGSGILAEFYYAKPLRHVPAGTSLEDRGIYFRLTAKVL